MMFEQQVLHYIEREQLLDKKSPVLVALSGGADSVALLRVLTSLGYSCEAAHCNFQLRGAESDRDESFVQRLTTALQVPLHVIHFDTIAYATEHHLSIEMAARELRYDFFRRLLKERNLRCVAVAHHRDDSVETALLNLIRGTGILGLRGIQSNHDGVVRPLLCVSRQEILDYLQSLNQPYVTDHTNLEDTFVRNKIRLRLLPLMEELNPSVKNSIAETSGRLAELSVLYQQTMEEGKRRVCSSLPIGLGFTVDIQALLREPAPRSLLFELVRPLGFPSGQAELLFELLQAPSGRQVEHGDWVVLKDRTSLWVYPKPADDWARFEHPIDLLELTAHPETPFECLLPDGCRLELSMKEWTPECRIDKSREVALMDVAKIQGPLTVRLWNAGDRFIPFGMKGSKLLSDYMTDRKFSLWKKQHQWVVCSGDAVVWLVRERTDQRVAVEASTRTVLVLRVKP